MLPLTIPATLGAILVLAAGSAVISGMEAAFFSLHSYQIRRLRERNPGCCDVLDELIENPRRFLSVILLVDTIINVSLSLLALYAVREFGLPLQIPLWVSALVLFAVIVIVCDLFPKVLAAREPYRFAAAGLGMLRRILPVVEPISSVLERSSEKVADLLTPRRVKVNRSLSEDEIETMVQLGEEQGALHAIESEMIQEILKLGDKAAKDCMTPRVEVFAIPDALSNEEALEAMKKRRIRRVPVYGETPDDILGILDARRFLIRENEKTHFTEVMDPPSFVPETMPALTLLRSFLKHPQGLAIVLDEFGGVEGVVTFTDIIEEIISDAVPRADQGLYIEKLKDDRLLVSGSARLDDLSEELGVELREEGVDTIQGLLFNRVGQLPKPGTTLELKGIRVTVRRSTRKRIRELLLELLEPPMEDEVEGSK